jgi:hypothetical protein
MLPDVLLPLLLGVADRVNDPTPEPEEVKAGWTAFAIFLLLIAAVVVLSFSLVKQLRKAQSAKDAGVYGDEPVRDEPTDQPGDGPADGGPRGRVSDE